MPVVTRLTAEDIATVFGQPKPSPTSEYEPLLRDLKVGEGYRLSLDGEPAAKVKQRISTVLHTQLCRRDVQLNFKVVDDNTLAFVLRPSYRSGWQARPMQMVPSVTVDDEGSDGIELLDLCQRTYNCLLRSQIRRVSQVLALNDHQLLLLRNFGQASLAEVRAKLQEHGYGIAA